MTEVTLVGSTPATDSSHCDVLIDGNRVGEAIIYYTGKAEVDVFKKKLKKKVKVGEAYTVKIFLDEAYAPIQSDLLKIRDSFLMKYPTCGASKVLFSRKASGKTIPLTDGSKLEAYQIGNS